MPAEQRGLSLASAEGWASFADADSDAGVAVNADNICTVGSAWQALQMISGDTSKIPLNVYKRLPDQGREIATNHQAQRFIEKNGRANEADTSLQLWRKGVFGAALYGAGFIWINRTAGGIEGLYNLLPDRTEVVPGPKLGQKVVVTEFQVDGRHELQPIPYDDVIHIESPGHGSNPPNAIRRIRHDIGLALSRRDFQSKFYGMGGHQGGVLHVPTGSKAEHQKKMEDALEDQRKKPKLWFKSVILRDGYKFEKTTSTVRDAQAVDGTATDAREIARHFNMSPSMLGVPGSEGYNSLEARRRDYHDTTLGWWLSSILSQCNVKLLTERQRERRTHFIDYNVAALLWADTKTVAEVADKAVLAGWMLPDEARRLFNFNPLPNGQGAKIRVPLNMGSAEDIEDTESAEPPETVETEPQDERTTDQPDAAIYEVHRELFENTVRRVVRRLIRAKGKNKLTDGDYQRSQIDPCHQIIADCVPAVAAVTGCSIDSREVALAAISTAARSVDLEDDQIVAKCVRHCSASFLRKDSEE